MLSLENTVLPVPVTANAELGRVAIATTETLRLKSNLDAGVTIRGHAALGELRIAHQKTKEFGGGYRHTVRFNLKQNGDLPAAFASLTVGSADDAVANGRSLEAVYLLLMSLAKLGGISAENIEAEMPVSRSGNSLWFTATAESPFDVCAQFLNGVSSALSRVSGNEG